MTAEQHDDQVVTATFEGEPISAPRGSSVAAALIGTDRVAWRTTRDGRPRGLFCGIGVCFDCIVEIDGESGQRACMIPLEDGMEVCAARSAPRDGGAASGGTTANEPNPEAQSQ